MIDLHMLKKEDIGRKVVYHREFCDRQEGELTSWNENYVFVKFKGPGGEACEPGDVTFAGRFPARPMGAPITPVGKNEDGFLLHAREPSGTWADAVLDHISPLQKDSLDLLPCPFCGEVAVEDETEQGDGQVRYEVKCSLCNASQYSYTSLRRAGIGWNARFETNSVNTDKTA